MSAGLLVCAPLAVEARALRASMPDTRVVRAGYRASGPPDEEFDALAVAGLGGALTADVRPGDVVVASEVRGRDRTVACPSAPLLAGRLRRAGLRVHCGPVASTDHVVHGRERAELAGTGALAVDMESAALAGSAGGGPLAGSAGGGPLAGSAGGCPLAVVRVVADTPDAELLRPGMLRRTLVALRTLRTVGPALAQWAAATGPRRVLLPAPRSFCAGVERAIDIVERALDRCGPPVYVRKQIVHNAHVVADLAARGAVFVDELDQIPDGAATVFSAHGVAPAVREQAAAKRLDVIDGTCPLVSKVHAEARRFTREPGTVLLIGHGHHEETAGTLGQAPGRIRLVRSVDDAAAIEVPDPERVSYVTQTTLSVDEASEIVDTLRARFPALRGPGSDDICYATTNRQHALRAVADQTELVLVLGSANSSNAQRLAETARRRGAAAHLVEDVSQVRLEWLTGLRSVSVTAGASAPPELVDELVDTLGGLGPLDVAEHRLVTENIEFALPKEVS